MKLNGEIDGKTRQWDVEGSGQSPLDIKRRRLTLNGIRNGRTESPDTETFAASPQRAYVSRSYQMLPPVRPLRNGEDGRFHDPSLTLPPLQTNMPTLLHNQRNVEATVMTIPFINKIKLLAKISPPLATRSKPIDAWSRGAVIAVDGHDLTLVNDMLKYLGRLLTKEGRYAVRVFEGPEINGRQACSKVGEAGRDATVDYLNIISAWHRISDEIVQFISQPAKAATPIASEDGSSPEVSPKTISPRTLGSRAISGRNPVPIALVPRYQLTTADLYACAIPINDAYAPLDHWQWMASLWRACVGPDVTVYVRECEKEEVDRYGGGNPVEVRLQDARTLVVRRAIGSPREIDEKALKRVGFEVEDFLTR
jgi:HMG box factor, other